MPRRSGGFCIRALSSILVWHSQPSGLWDLSIGQGFRESAERCAGPLCAATLHFSDRLHSPANFFQMKTYFPLLSCEVPSS